MDAQQKEEQKARAFKAFQDAARNKESDPDTFEAARARYYFLTKGPAWFSQEKKRISSEKIDPVLDQYRDTYTSLLSESAVQQGYTDSIAGIRDKQDTLRHGVATQSSFLEKLLSSEEQKKGVWDRLVELTSPSYTATSPPTQDVPLLVGYFAGYPSSFSIIMDIVLGVMVVVILYLLVTKTKYLGSWMSTGASAVSQLSIEPTPSGQYKVMLSPTPRTVPRPTLASA